MGSGKKHKKHKSDRWGRCGNVQDQGTDRPQLRLILKVGGSSTPEADNSDGSLNRQVTPYVAYGVEEESRQSSHYSYSEGGEREKHKKKKEKKKKKNKDKDKDRDKERKKHKHKDKKHKERDESPSAQPQEEDAYRYEVVPVDSPKVLQNTPTSPRPVLKISATSAESGTALSSSLGSRGLRTSLRPRHGRPALQKLLEILLPGLEQKDPRQFFAWPVTDSIAPGYSTIITKPMDLSTMKQKIEDNDYKTLQEFTDDFVLMCNNAMVYNQPDTIYYKAAKRLLHTGLRILSPEKVRPLVPTVCTMGELSSQQLGFEPLEESFRAFQNRQQQQQQQQQQGPIVGAVESGADHDVEMGFSSGGETMVETVRDTFLKKDVAPTASSSNQFEVLPDDMTPDEILEQVQEAAQMAAVKLESQHPYAKYGFLRQRKDGTTSLAILTPCDLGVEPGSNQVPVTLGMLTGKVQPGPGTGQLRGFHEDRRNIVKPAKPLYYGPFGSYAPSYDSTFSNLTKEESDLVYSTYGEETGVQYAESILDFVRDCDYALHIADDLLNLMTHGEHASVAKVIDDKRKLQQQQQQQVADQDFNLNSLRSLGDLGIDVSFVDDFEMQMKAGQSVREVSQSYLDETGSLISSLERVQRERLSKTPPPHLSNIMPPSDLELQLAEKITESITFVAKQTAPGAVAAVRGVRKAIGISTHLPTPPLLSQRQQQQQLVHVETQPNDLENELSKLLGEDASTSDAMTDMFH